MAFLVGFMIAGGIILLLMAMIFAVDAWPSRKMPTVKRETGPRLSAPSKRLLKLYRELPDDVQAQFGDLEKALAALDVSHGIEAVNGAFRQAYSTDFSWTSRYSRSYHEYHVLKNQIDEVRQAHQAREKALAVAAVQPDLDRLKEITEGLRTEAQIIKQVTKELA